MPDPVEPAERGETTALVERRDRPVAPDQGTLGERTRHALDMLALGKRRIAKYELLLSRIVGEIGRFAEAARRERSQLEDEVRRLKQELSTLRKEHAATEQRLINSQLDCWSLQLRIQAMKDARAMFDGLQPEKRPDRSDGRVIDAD